MKTEPIPGSATRRPSGVGVVVRRDRTARGPGGHVQLFSGVGCPWKFRCPLHIRIERPNSGSTFLTQAFDSASHIPQFKRAVPLGLPGLVQVGDEHHPVFQAGARVPAASAQCIGRAYAVLAEAGRMSVVSEFDGLMFKKRDGLGRNPERGERVAHRVLRSCGQHALRLIEGPARCRQPGPYGTTLHLCV
jgi:hypothetical protein